jgi:alkaline phosphatase D
MPPLSLVELTRRGLLSSAAAWLAGCSVRQALRPTDLLLTTRVPANPFTLGVASGDPRPDGVVLWTRLAPDPVKGGGMPPQAVVVDWQVATDEKMEHVVRDGWALALPELGHSVHVELERLEPSRHYWYRFRAGADLSPVGRTRTAPPAGAHVDRVRFAFTSCHAWQAGLYTGYRHLIDEDLDFLVHLGDYIYEGGVAANAIRPHNGPEIFTLDDYRNRYALYKTDPLLQAAHAAMPWVVTWDDHEVHDNYAGVLGKRGEDPRLFLLRRAAAYQAFYEHLPLRRSSLPARGEMQLYRRLSYGNLLDLHVLDTRQYRTVQPGLSERGPRVIEDPGIGGELMAAAVTTATTTSTARASASVPGQAPTMLGDRQEAWLFDGLSRSSARWNALAQGIFVAQRIYPTPPETTEVMVNLDKWDGFPAARRRLLGFLGERRLPNTVILTGDEHTGWVADLKANFDDPASPTLASEFVGTALSSGGDGSDTNPNAQAILATNPHVKFHSGRRGYVRCQLDHKRWQADLRAMPFVTRPGAPIATCASFVIEAGHPGAQRTG